MWFLNFERFIDFSHHTGAWNLWLSMWWGLGKFTSQVVGLGNLISYLFSFVSIFSTVSVIGSNTGHGGESHPSILKESQNLPILLHISTFSFALENTVQQKYWPDTWNYIWTTPQISITQKKSIPLVTDSSTGDSKGSKNTYYLWRNWLNF